MKKSILIIPAAILAFASITTAGNRGKVVDEKTVAKITEAMPEKPPAKPGGPRKVLVYSKCAGFYHGCIPTANKAFAIMGKKTGAFEAVVSDDLAHFAPEKLKAFDAVIFNNSTGNLFKPAMPRKPRTPNPKRIKDPAKLATATEKYEKALARYQVELEKAKAQPDTSAAVRKALMAYVKNGGGIVGCHAATDTRGWDEYNEMIGGRFSGHPWHEPVPVKNDDPDNPINAAFGGTGFAVTDEIYQFNKGFYSRDKQRVLLSLDYDKLKKKKGSRKDNDYAVSWVKTCGKGRIFYCSLGHRNEIFWNPKVLQHYLAGIQWVTGDLEGVEAAPK